MAIIILFNSSTGSDTAASGSSLPATALSGTTASFAGSVVTLDGSPDLSAFDAGTWVLWMDCTTGRQFFDLSAADNGAKTVTTVNAPAGTATGRTWGIGGKRATLDNANSRKLGADCKANWTVRLETDQTLNSTAFPWSSGGTVEGDSTSTRRVINQTANISVFALSSTFAGTFRNLKFTNSNATKTSAHGINNAAVFTAVNCIFGDATNKLQKAVNDGGGTNHSKFFDCEVTNTNSNGIDQDSGGATEVIGCWVHDCNGIGVRLRSAPGSTVANSIIEGNASDGIAIFVSASQRCTIINNTIHGNTGDGLDISDNVDIGKGIVVAGNSFSSNGNYGWRGMSDTDLYLGYNDYNNYHSNTSGARLSVSAGANDTALDPQFTDAAGNDFSIGTNLKEKGFPGTRNVGANQSATKSYVDAGAAQRQEAASAAAVSTLFTRNIGTY